VCLPGPGRAGPGRAGPGRAGFGGPLPVGVSFFGSRWNEFGLVRIAHAFEQTVQARRPPQYLPSIG